MEIKIRPFVKKEMSTVVDFSIKAWAPVFKEWERLLGKNLYQIAIYKNWKKVQAETVRKHCGSPKYKTWVAEFEGKAIGYITLSFNLKAKKGEIMLFAVNPKFQNNGIGTELNLFALKKFKENRIIVAEVGTGGDAGHAPARKCYEKVGFKPLPVVRYYIKL